tara:strand:+ start:6480 stop:8072 length:1593 start_codon:yes stop_codon:yes gene_type:complete
MKIAFVSDFFLIDGMTGGAELANDRLIQHMRGRDYTVQIYRSHEFHDVSQHDYFIISNFVNMSEETKEALLDKPYLIYEHDHKYLKNRNPSAFPDFKAPPHMIVNEKFYRCAKAVLCQSKIHAEVVKKNLAIRNVVNVGCSLWHKEHLETLRKHCKDEKAPLHAVLGSNNAIKGTAEAEQYCKDNQLEYNVLPFSEFDEFVENIASHETLVFFPKTLETFCRVVMEARMVGCKLITNDWNGCTHEEWFPNYKGEALIDFVESKQEEVVDKVCHFLSATVTNVDPEDITVILNCYRRPYNLRMQIDALRSQTKPPKEIWLWVNQHPDNEGFSFDSLGLDKVFHNDYNWKFYGRFAGALLADTEYVAIFDDDTIPGSKWFENCLDTMEVSEGIMGSAGIILDDKYYVRHERSGWATQNPETDEVDLVGHAWFFKRDWLQYLWREKPPTWDNGEDMHFSYSAQKYGGIKTYCPPHPPEDRELHGSIMGNELGIDEKATSNNNETSHQQFFTERDFCVQEALRKGWQTVRGVKL